MPDLKALIFDFDGTIIDTETSAFRAWETIYRDHGQNLAIEEYAQCIGTGHDVYNPQTVLDSRVSQKINWDVVTPHRRALESKFLKLQTVLPGVRELIGAAQSEGLGLAIGSSSPRAWIDRVMPLTDPASIFATIVTSDDAPPKPCPDIYRIALDRLGISDREAVVIEDSPNGAMAAQRAGIFCVIVPNALTHNLTFQSGDLRTQSLDRITLSEIRAAHGRHHTK